MTVCLIPTFWFDCPVRFPVTVHGYQTCYHSRYLDGSRVEESVSVAIEEVKPLDWAENVYQPDVVNNSEKLYKKPGYTM